ncbi:hypothetical protein I7I48_01908 [Histoplasma ohiense]|nr:hypothetical protein I7I48_01908 [Histoplasma ohiense (nom. inval.)]
MVTGHHPPSVPIPCFISRLELRAAAFLQVFFFFFPLVTLFFFPIL